MTFQALRASAALSLHHLAMVWAWVTWDVKGRGQTILSSCRHLWQFWYISTSTKIWWQTSCTTCLPTQGLVCATLHGPALPLVVAEANSFFILNLLALSNCLEHSHTWKNSPEFKCLSPVQCILLIVELQLWENYFYNLGAPFFESLSYKFIGCQESTRECVESLDLFQPLSILCFRQNIHGQLKLNTFWSKRKPCEANITTFLPVSVGTVNSKVSFTCISGHCFGYVITHLANTNKERLLVVILFLYFYLDSKTFCKLPWQMNFYRPQFWSVPCMTCVVLRIPGIT